MRKYYTFTTPYYDNNAKRWDYISTQYSGETVEDAITKFKEYDLNHYLNKLENAGSFKADEDYPAEGRYASWQVSEHLGAFEVLDSPDLTNAPMKRTEEFVYDWAHQKEREAAEAALPKPDIEDSVPDLDDVGDNVIDFPGHSHPPSPPESTSSNKSTGYFWGQAA